MRVVDIGCCTVPLDDQAPLIQQQPQLATNNPLRIRQAFLADLLRAALLSDGVQKLNTIAVGHTQDGRVSQKPGGPIAMRTHEAKQARAFGQAGEQMQIIAFEPAIKGTRAAPHDGKQQDQGDQLAGKRLACGCFSTSCI